MTEATAPTVGEIFRRAQAIRRAQPELSYKQLHEQLVREQIDDDIREEYWTSIRKKREMKRTRSFKCPGKYSR